MRWKYIQDTGEPEFIWTTGKVVRVADGLADQRSARAKKILPAGALLWAWEADEGFKEKAGEQWLILLPDKWNRQVQYGFLALWPYIERETLRWGRAGRSARRRSRALQSALSKSALGPESKKGENSCGSSSSTRTWPRTSPVAWRASPHGWAWRVTPRCWPGCAPSPPSTSCPLR